MFEWKWQDLVTMRAYRILKGMKLFRVPDSQGFVYPISLRSNETLIGVYENNPNTSLDALVITTYGILLLSENGATIIDFHEILDIQSPPTKEPPLEALTIQEKSGELIALPIRGGEGNFRDAWEFLRFLRRVRDDANRMNIGNKA